ncbi:hypothetical protein CF137_18145 [Aeromonas sobria]|nr:hypothetical protein CF137_18145 [Aeromonas sobria]
MLLLATSLLYVLQCFTKSTMRHSGPDTRIQIKLTMSFADLDFRSGYLASLLNEADATILELYNRIADLERELPTSNVLLIDPRGRKKLESGS